ncbi:MAG: hypothetical protein L6R35_005749 [Caloplaca aegaea]|nr:MAG: hypothetical protein L6R35_005749 [Caloplaca aegaea]
MPCIRDVQPLLFEDVVQTLEGHPAVMICKIFGLRRLSQPRQMGRRKGKNAAHDEIIAVSRI